MVVIFQNIFIGGIKKPLLNQELFIKNENENEKDNIKKINGIPLQVFQTYKRNMNYNVLQGMKLLRDKNTEFKFYFYDDEDMKKFIVLNFDEEVLNAFNSLKSNSYKADLFRYCILYKYGGIYLDIKFVMEDNLSLKELLNDNVYVVDDTICTREFKEYDNTIGEFIYQIILVSKPENIIFSQAIQKIVDRTKNYCVGKNPLDITGPNFFGNLLKELDINFDKKKIIHKGDGNVFLNDKLYIKTFKSEEYYLDMGENNRYFNNFPYSVYYKSENINYNKKELHNLITCNCKLCRSKSK